MLAMSPKQGDVNPLKRASLHKLMASSKPCDSTSQINVAVAKMKNKVTRLDYMSNHKKKKKKIGEVVSHVQTELCSHYYKPKGKA